MIIPDQRPRRHGKPHPQLQYVVADHWEEVNMAEWPWSNFSPEEMACSKTYRIRIGVAFMTSLQALRDAVGLPLQVNSGFRSIEHDKSIGGANVHPSGCAVDIACYGQLAARVLYHAPALGFTGMGISQKGKYAGRFIHLDTIDDEFRPRPWVWSY